MKTSYRKVKPSSYIKIYYALMKKILLITFICFLNFSYIHGQANNGINIIPKPFDVNLEYGEFVLDSETEIHFPPELKDEAAYFLEKISISSGIKIDALSIAKDKNIIELNIDKKLVDNYGKEGYELIVTEKKIEIVGASNSGVFYGLQTLLQLLPAEAFSRVNISAKEFTVPCIRITDYPRFSWRGFMLDASRHFQPVEYVKQTLDLMAIHKMNVFHWHLTDDHGWRIEIKQYPWLTETGAWRNQPNFPVKGEINPYGGFYTQEQIREIVKYASERHITIVPEIDLPGHSSALVHAIPEMACVNARKDGYVHYFRDYPMRERNYIRHRGTNVVCAGEEDVYRIIDNILGEIVDLFPSNYIHIGGDEVKKKWWEACPVCQKRLHEEGLQDMNELQSYFIGRLEKMLNNRGRNLIGWEEILDGNLSPSASVMGWIGMARSMESVKQGRETVIASNSAYYVQMSQTDNPFHPQRWPLNTTTKNIYEFDPIPPELTEEEKELILGIQTSLWTPFTNKEELWDIATYPRNCALAEAAWTQPELKDWDDFQIRMQKQYQRLAYLGVSYWRENQTLIGEWDTDDIWEKESVLTFDVTSVVNQPGVYFFLGDLEEGVETVFKKSILLKDGKQIASDKHMGYVSQERNDDRIYFLDIQHIDKNSKYEVVFDLKGTLGEVSRGKIYVIVP